MSDGDHQHRHPPQEVDIAVPRCRGAVSDLGGTRPSRQHCYAPCRCAARVVTSNRCRPDRNWGRVVHLGDADTKGKRSVCGIRSLIVPCRLGMYCTAQLPAGELKCALRIPSNPYLVSRATRGCALASYQHWHRTERHHFCCLAAEQQARDPYAAKVERG